MKFDLQKSIDMLSRTPAVLETLLKEVSEEWTSANEGANTWSPFDVLGHLIQGEETDWIPRAKIILSGSKEPFEPFDRFAQLEKSKGKNLEQLLAEFTRLREANLEQLNSFKLTEEELNLTGTHPALGKVSLKNLLATWTAHDLSHIAQISRVMAKQYREEVGVWVEYMRIMD